MSVSYTGLLQGGAGSIKEAKDAVLVAMELAPPVVLKGQGEGVILGICKQKVIQRQQQGHSVSTEPAPGSYAGTEPRCQTLQAHCRGFHRQDAVRSQRPRKSPRQKSEWGGGMSEGTTGESSPAAVGWAPHCALDIAQTRGVFQRGTWTLRRDSGRWAPQHKIRALQLASGLTPPCMFLSGPCRHLL